MYINTINMSDITGCNCSFIKVTNDQNTNTSDSKRSCNLSSRIDINKIRNTYGSKQLLLHSRVERQRAKNSCK